MLIGEHECTDVSVTSSTSLTCTTTAGTDLAANVTATTPGGTGTLSSAYSYLDPPTVISVNPAHGSVVGGNTVLITGTGFEEVMGASIGEADCTSYDQIDSSHVSCVVPAGTGTVDVGVRASNGDGTLTSGYTYQVPSGGAPSPTATPTPTASPSPEPSPSGSPSPSPSPDPSDDPGPDDTPALDLTLHLTTGGSVVGAQAGISGSGLRPSSPYTLIMHSEPVVVASGLTDRAGSFHAVLRLPGKVCVHGGQHQLTLTGLAPDGTPVTDTDWIVLDDTCHSRGTYKTAPHTVRHESNFLFDYLSARLTPAGTRTLNQLAPSLRRAKFVILTGYTQTELTSAAARRANIALAHRRAITVKLGLQHRHVRARIALVAAGPVNPVSTRRQRLNRRVTITWFS